MRDASFTPPPAPRSRQARLDAIIVPSTRPASALSGIIEMAASIDTPLVVLASDRSALDLIDERISRIPGARGLVVHIGNDYSLPIPPFQTSSDVFRQANAERRSNLSLKRNFGLLLARFRGWQKILFVDDDITLSASGIARTAALLGNHQIAGMVCRHFPDNSVFCHARRLAKQPQDNFVSGAVLGVNCSDVPVPFFPDLYNEDWFFFGEAAARHQLTKAGQATQAPYDPFADPERARREEFGDLLAEGLYSLMEDLGSRSRFQDAVHLAGSRFWASCVSARQDDLARTAKRLKEFTLRQNCSDGVLAAIESLDAATLQYTSGAITPEGCEQFLAAWQQDTADWSRIYARANSLPSLRDALLELAVTDWRVNRLESQVSPSRASFSRASVRAKRNRISKRSGRPTIACR